MTGRNAWVTRETDLVIEGFPRSANTYFMRIIRAACEHRLTIASHVHRPEQLVFANRYAVPCVAIFRDPLESVASLVVREPSYGVAASIKRYRKFCEAALSLHSSQLLILDFGDIVAQPAPMAEGVLDTFGLRHLPVTRELIANATRDERENKTMSSLPNAAKDAAKSRVYDRIRADGGFVQAHELFEAARKLSWRPTALR